MMKASIILFLFGLAISYTSCKIVPHKKHAYMKHAFKKIKDSFPEANVTMLNDSIQVIFPNNIVFNSNESSIAEQFVARLHRFAIILNAYPKTNMLITGHADSTGNEELNNKLSLDRAKQVKEQLISFQVKAERLFTWGLGKKLPIASNETQEGRAQNRRVEFVILYNSN